MNICLRISVLLVFGNLILFAAPKRPAWVDSRPSAPHLFQGIGVSDDTGSKEEDRFRADQNARVEIIQEISSTITTQVSSYYEETVKNNKAEVSDNTEMYSSLSSIYADGTIEGIKIVDRYYDKKNKTYYSHATLLRSEFESQMARRATTAKLFAKDLFQQAQTVLKAGDPRSALNNLSKALSHVLVAQSIIKKQLQFDLDNDGKLEFLDARLSQDMVSILNGFSFVKLGGDEQKGERDQALSVPIEGQVRYTQNGESTPMKNAALSIKLEGAKAEFSEVISTDKDGNFTLGIDKIISASSPTPKIMINIHLPDLAIYYATQGVDLTEVLPNGLTYTFKIDVAASVNIFVRVLEEVNGGRVSKAGSEGRLIKALIKEKYKVIDVMRIARSISVEELDFALYYEDFESLTETLTPHATYAIVGIVSSETSSTGPLNYARAAATLNVIDLESGRILSSGNQDNIKAAGNTEKKANKAALKKCSDTAITELLAGLETALN